jgi:hypothetical protein
MESSSSYLDYKNFERVVNKFTRFIDAAEDPRKIICTRTVAEMVADKPYRIVYYNDVPIYLVILSQNKEKNRVGNIGFAFYDDKHGLFEGEVVDFLMSQPKLKITEVQVRATAGLEETLQEVKKPGLAGSSPKQN